MCLDARDPYCGWDRKQRRCTTIEDSSNMSQWFQNITACPVRVQGSHSFMHDCCLDTCPPSPTAAFKSLLCERCYAAWLIASLEPAAFVVIIFWSWDSARSQPSNSLFFCLFFVFLIYSSWGTKPQMVRMGPGLHGSPVAMMMVKAPARVFVDRGHVIVHRLAVEEKTVRVPPLRCPTVQGK